MSSPKNTRSSRRRGGRLGAVAAGLCLALAGTGVATATGEASGAAQKAHRGQVSSGRLAYSMRALEAKGYVQTSCTVNGSRMTDPRTGRSVTVTW